MFNPTAPACPCWIKIYDSAFCSLSDQLDTHPRRGLPAHGASVPTPTSIAAQSQQQSVQLTVLYGVKSKSGSSLPSPTPVREIRYAAAYHYQRDADQLARQWIILAGDHVDAWLPASSWWLSLLNEKWAQQHPSSRPIVGSNADAAAVLVSSPVVIAMWEPLARLLGWPNKAISWGDIAALSVDPRGWGAVGRPDLGAFTFAHTNPALSNSGLNALAAIAYAAAGKVNNLTCQDVQRADVQALVRNVESSIIYYGESTGFFADQMLARHSLRRRSSEIWSLRPLTATGQAAAKIGVIYLRGYIHHGSPIRDPRQTQVTCKARRSGIPRLSS
jgi:hypothetical protein